MMGKFSTEKDDSLFINRGEAVLVSFLASRLGTDSGVNSRLDRASENKFPASGLGTSHCCGLQLHASVGLILETPLLNLSPTKS